MYDSRLSPAISVERGGYWTVQNGGLPRIVDRRRKFRRLLLPNRSGTAEDSQTTLGRGNVSTFPAFVDASITGLESAEEAFMKRRRRKHGPGSEAKAIRLVQDSSKGPEGSGGTIANSGCSGRS